MNSAESLEFRLIRDEQQSLHRLMRQLDTRVDLLGRRLEMPAVPVQSAPPPVPSRPAVPPPLPTSPVEAPAKPLSPEAGAPPVMPERHENIAPPPLERPKAPVNEAPHGPEAPQDPATPGPLPIPPAPPTEPLELRVGTFWMARIGIVILLTGLVFLGNYAYHRIVPILGPWGKLALLAMAGGALAGLGSWMERTRESLKNYGRVLLAGGAATLYYTVYAAHYVETLRVIQSPWLAGVLLLAMAGGFLWHAERRRSERLALMAVLLAYYTSSINHVGEFTLVSNLLLTAVAVFLLVRHRWVWLSFASLIGTYLSFVFWRLNHLLHTGGAVGEFGVGVWCLACYWALFTAAVFIADRDTMPGGKRVAFLTLNNGAFFAFGADHFVRHWPGQFWVFAMGYGAVLLGLSVLAVRRYEDEKPLDGAYLLQGLGLVTLGFIAKLTGPQLAVTLAVESAVLLTCSRRRHGWLFEGAAALCGLGALSIAFAKVALSDGSPLGVAGVVAVIFGFNAWWGKRLEKNEDEFSWRALGYSVAGLVLFALVIWQEVPSMWRPAAFAGLALAGVGALRIRMPELALPAQAGLVFGLALFLIQGEVPQPWFSPLPLVAIALGLSHWWTHRPVAMKELETVLPVACAAVAVVALGAWLNRFFSEDQWLLASSLAALGTLAYGLATQVWPVAVVGQVFTLVGILAFGEAMVSPDPSPWLMLAPIVNLSLAGMAFRRFGAVRLPALPAGLPWRDLETACHFVATIMAMAWVFKQIDVAWWLPVFGGLGAVQLFYGAVRKDGGRMRIGAVFAAVGAGTFWLGMREVGWLDLLTILALPASLRLGRKIAGELPISTLTRDAVVMAALASAWWWVTRFTIQHGWGNMLTVSWAILALLALAAGLALRERIYRVGGFAILGLAIGRLFIIDVWSFDTIYRILSFLVLGGVLLALSFVYHRFAETMRKWL